MDELRIENAGPTFIARLWGTASKRQRITLVCEQGWPMFPTDHYIEIEFSRAGERAGRVHGRIVRIDGSEMVIDGHFAGHPMKVWHTL